MGSYYNNDRYNNSGCRNNGNGSGGYRAGDRTGPGGRRNGRYGGKRNRTRRGCFSAAVLVTALAAVFVLIYGVTAMCGSDKDSGNGIISFVQQGVSGSDEVLPEPEPDPVELKAQEILSGMTTEQKVGALLLVRGDTIPEERFKAMISDVHAGGAVLFKSDFAEKDRAGVIAYTSALQQAGGGHMLLCVDEEGGSVVRLSSNKLLREKKFNSPQYIYKNGGLEAIADDTREKCGFLKEFGINVNFAPVADVVTDEKGFLYSRAFGADARATAEYVGTVVGIMRQQNMGSSIKHFPGYGNAHGDTHKGLVESAVTEESLRESDLVPFIRGIEAGADSVMVTHTIVSCIDPERPCSLSPSAIALLRDEMGFDGVVVTDGLDMGAIQEFCGGSDPCVKALLAGCDLMCTPADAYSSYDQLLAAVNSGEITQERLDVSVLRILKWKVRLGLYPENDG